MNVFFLSFFYFHEYSEEQYYGMLSPVNWLYSQNILKILNYNINFFYTVGIVLMQKEHLHGCVVLNMIYDHTICQSDWFIWEGSYFFFICMYRYDKKLHLGQKPSFICIRRLSVFMCFIQSALRKGQFIFVFIIIPMVGKSSAAIVW